MAAVKFPHWFHPSSRPFAPDKPPERVDEYDALKEVSAYEWEYLAVDEIPKDATHLRLEHTGGYDSERMTLTFMKKRNVANPNYQKSLQEYKKSYQGYKERLKEWKKWKGVWDEGQKELAAAENHRLYEKLKKQFEEKK